MKLGEIKLEALRIMNINNDSPLYLDKIETLVNEKRYGKYLNNMFNAINKAIDIINHRRVLPQKKVQLSTLLHSEGKVNNRYKTDSLKDFLSISRIVYESESQYFQRVPYAKEADELVILSQYEPEYLSLIYDSKIANITDANSDKEEIPGLPENLARLIPYYIKFELYQEDEPDLALNAKGTFDQGIESLRVYDDVQEEFNIENVYSSEDFA